MNRTWLILIGVLTVACAADGTSYVTDLESIPPGAECPAGGIRVATGPDSNGNGSLDPSEVASSEAVCQGVDGSNGSNGTNGATGADGTSTLLLVTRVGPGGTCPAGGVRIDGGPDTDGDGVLDAAEIATTTLVCDGADGADGLDGVSSLSRSSTEPPGERCPTGGVRFDQGPDTNGNGALDASEIASTSYVCDTEVTSAMSVETNEFLDYDSTPTVVQSATITVPSAGRVVAIGGASLSWSNGDVSTNDSAWAYLTLCHLAAVIGSCRSNLSLTFPVTGTLGYLPEYSVTSFATFDVPEGGTVTIQLLAAMGEEGDTGSAGRRSLLLFFLPD